MITPTATPFIKREEMLLRHERRRLLPLFEMTVETLNPPVKDAFLSAAFELIRGRTTGRFSTHVCVRPSPDE